jgi:hypothetical protein
MASKFAYSRALRTVGQALEKRQIDLFDLRCDQNEYFLQCGDPTPPHFSLVELRYSFADLHDLDLDARDNRAASFKPVNFANAPPTYRTLSQSQPYNRLAFSPRNFRFDSSEISLRSRIVETT